MTLGDFFNHIGENPSWVLFYFIAIPLIAGLALLFGKGEGNASPWRELYSCLVYAVALPGIFAITLNAYLFLFEKRSVFDANIYTHILPIVSMVLTLWLIRRNVCFEDIPGFGRLGGLIILILILFSIMWILEKTHIFVISVMPFYYFIIIMIVLLVGGRYALKSILK